MTELKNLEHIMYENYTVEELLKVYKLKLLSLKKEEQNKELIDYYRDEIIRLNKYINNQNNIKGKTK